MFSYMYSVFPQINVFVMSVGSLYYPMHHPNVGVLLMKVGKIQLYLHRSREAIAYLTDVSAQW